MIRRMENRRRSFEAQALPHLDAAYNLARWLSRSPADAEDIVQDAMLRAFRGFDGFRGGDAKPWLLAIVRNCCRNLGAETRRRAQTPFPAHAAAAIPSRVADAATVGDAIRMHAARWRAAPHLHARISAAIAKESRPWRLALQNRTFWYGAAGGAGLSALAAALAVFLVLPAGPSTILDSVV